MRNHLALHASALTLAACGSQEPSAQGSTLGDEVADRFEGARSERAQSKIGSRERGERSQRAREPRPGRKPGSFAQEAMEDAGKAEAARTGPIPKQ